MITQTLRDNNYKDYYYKILINSEIMRYIKLVDYDQTYNDEFGLTISFKDKNNYKFDVLWNRCDDVEVRASFVKQTEYQHLGFTNNLYTPLKQYELECADNEFWIDLYNNDQMKTVILPDDSKDMVVIETQLILKP